MYDSRNRIIKTAPLIWRSILVNEDTCMLHLPSYLKTSYLQPWNATSAKLISHLWALTSTWRSLLSKYRGEIADAPAHKEVLRRRQAGKYFAPGPLCVLLTAM